jgi:hypothetical protein
VELLFNYVGCRYLSAILDCPNQHQTLPCSLLTIALAFPLLPPPFRRSKLLLRNKGYNLAVLYLLSPFNPSQHAATCSSVVFAASIVPAGPVRFCVRTMIAPGTTDARNMKSGSGMVARAQSPAQIANTVSSEAQQCMHLALPTTNQRKLW